MFHIIKSIGSELTLHVQTEHCVFAFPWINSYNIRTDRYTEERFSTVIKESKNTCKINLYYNTACKLKKKLKIYWLYQLHNILLFIPLYFYWCQNLHVSGSCMILQSKFIYTLMKLSLLTVDYHWYIIYFNCMYVASTKGVEYLWCCICTAKF